MPVYRPIIGTARLLPSLGLGIKSRHRSGCRTCRRTGPALLAMNHTSYLDFVLGGIPVDLRRSAAGALHGQGRHLQAPGRRTADARDEAHPGRPRRRFGVVPRGRRLPQARRDRRNLSRGDDEPESWRSRRSRTARSGSREPPTSPLIPMIIFGGHRLMSYGHRDLSHRGKHDLHHRRRTAAGAARRRSRRTDRPAARPPRRTSRRDNRAVPRQAGRRLVDPRAIGRQCADT